MRTFSSGRNVTTEDGLAGLAILESRPRGDPGVAQPVGQIGVSEIEQDPQSCGRVCWLFCSARASRDDHHGHRLARWLALPGFAEVPPVHHGPVLARVTPPAK